MSEHRTIKASKAKCLKPESLFGIDRGRIRLVGDAVAPVAGAWEAEADPERINDP